MERCLNGFLLTVLLGAAVPPLVQAQDDLDALLSDLHVEEECAGLDAGELNRCGLALLAKCAKADPEQHLDRQAVSPGHGGRCGWGWKTDCPDCVR